MSEVCECAHLWIHHNESGDCTDCDWHEERFMNWQIDDRATWPHREGPEGGWRTVRTTGTVTAVDKPGLPAGVELTFDKPTNGVSYCYATHAELEPLSPSLIEEDEQ